MQIQQIIQGVRNPSAGPSYSVARLADELHHLGHASSVRTLGAPPPDWQHDAKLITHDGWLERHTGISPAMAKAIHQVSASPCILHGHGVWRMANLFPLFVNNNAPARLLCSPRGMLSPWSMNYKASLKRPFWMLVQKPALDRCHCFHVTAPLELEDIRRLGFRTPVTVIPNGVDIPPAAIDIQRSKTLVFLSRIDPKKGLDILLPAWTAIAPEFHDWNLVIAGPLKGPYAKTVQDLAGKLNAPRVTFMGEVLGKEKYTLLSQASLFVLPTYSENFGIAVAEALAHGAPVITTTETPWTEIPHRDCGWCIAPTQECLEEALREAMSRSVAELQKMGANGRKWMEHSYAWTRIGEMMEATYAWLLGNSERPDCIHLE